MIKAYRDFIKNYLNTQGRTSVKDFWLTLVANMILLFTVGVFFCILIVISTIISEDLGTIMSYIWSGVAGLYCIFITIPGITMSIRRLHDTNKSGIVYLFCLLGSCCCGIGSIVLLIFCAMPGTIGDNQYGPDPRTYTF